MGANYEFLFCNSAIMISSEPIRILSLTYAHRGKTKSLLLGSEETVNSNLRVSTVVVALKPLIDKLTCSPTKPRRLTSDEDTQE